MRQNDKRDCMRRDAFGKRHVTMDVESVAGFIGNRPHRHDLFRVDGGIMRAEQVQRRLGAMPIQNVIHARFLRALAGDEHTLTIGAAINNIVEGFRDGMVDHFDIMLPCGIEIDHFAASRMVGRHCIGDQLFVVLLKLRIMILIADQLLANRALGDVELVDAPGSACGCSLDIKNVGVGGECHRSQRDAEISVGAIDRTPILARLI